ncbi:MAG: cation-translocating P-type ATPase [Planctomycetes bacterium]|nr:cation-translocating P-type ATPase [Planctomycetota bacterium]
MPSSDKQLDKTVLSIGGLVRRSLDVGGMHCPACATNIEKSVKQVNGVKDASVNLMRENVTVNYDPNLTDLDAIRKAITRLGYAVKESALEKTQSYFKERIFYIRMAVSALLIGAAWILDLTHLSHQALLWKLTISDILSLIVVIFGGYPIFKGAVYALKVRDLTVFSLVSIAGIAAVVVGAYKEAAMVILIMLIGETLEQSALRKTRKAISQLLGLTPSTALVRRNDIELEVPIDWVKESDIVIIKAGQRIPVDGAVIKGESAVNQSTLTGESMPVDKKTDDPVYSGTINESGVIEIRATGVGENTRLALIKRLIADAEAQKAPIQRLADRYARYFVPFILVLAVGVFLATGNIFKSITILIAACPCALVLATPTAIICGIRTAARNGILIKGGQYLEALGTLNALLMDKTGTLTAGRLQVTDVIGLNGTSQDEVLRLATIAEKRSEHPIAAAIISKAGNANITEPERVEIIKGLGIKAFLNNETILVGNKRFMESNSITMDDKANQQSRNNRDSAAAALAELSAKGRTALLVGRQSSGLMGLIGISDVPRDTTTASITAIKQAGIDRIAMLSGDNPGVCRNIADTVGLSECYSEMMPEDKVAKVNELKQSGYRVGMVGDGVNDAPALAAADVGIAMGAIGSAVAIESADISLMSDDIGKIPFAIKLSHRVRAIIKQNFIFAILYNIAIITALGLTVHSHSGITFGAVAHQISSLMVISNSLRLLR